jgi:hypothetical protein
VKDNIVQVFTTSNNVHALQREKIFLFSSSSSYAPVASSTHHPQLTDLAVIPVASSFSLRTYYPTLTTVIRTSPASPTSVPCLPGLTIALVPPYPCLLLYPHRAPHHPNTSATLHYPNLARCCPCRPNHIVVVVCLTTPFRPLPFPSCKRHTPTSTAFACVSQRHRRHPC